MHTGHMSDIQRTSAAVSLQVQGASLDQAPDLRSRSVPADSTEIASAKLLGQLPSRADSNTISRALSPRLTSLLVQRLRACCASSAACSGDASLAVMHGVLSPSVSSAAGTWICEMVAHTELLTGKGEAPHTCWTHVLLCWCLLSGSGSGTKETACTHSASALAYGEDAHACTRLRGVRGPLSPPSGLHAVHGGCKYRWRSCCKCHRLKRVGVYHPRGSGSGY